MSNTASGANAVSGGRFWTEMDFLLPLDTDL